MIRSLVAALLSLMIVLPASAAPWPSLTEKIEKVGGGENDAAVLIGVERYAILAGVPGATDNARDWFKYLRGARNVPLASITLLLDEEATVEKMRRFAGEAAAKVKPGGTLWFVFVGHGATSKDGKSGVLVGFDAQQEVESLYARSLA